MVEFKQTIFSIFSSIITILLYNVICLFNIPDKPILYDIMIIAFVLILNMVFGLFLGDRATKRGYIIQFAIMLLFAIITMVLDNTYFYIIGMIFNPLYAYTFDLFWQFNNYFDDALFFKLVVLIISSLLPCIVMYMGNKSKAITKGDGSRTQEGATSV